MADTSSFLAPILFDLVSGRSSWKLPVKVVATSNLTLAGAQTIDGVACAAEDEVLCVGQTSGAQNGVWRVASGAWTRRADCATAEKLYAGCRVPVTRGTHAGQVYRLTTVGTINVGVTAQSWELDEQGSGAGQFPVTSEGRIRIDQPTYDNVTGADALYSVPCFADVPDKIVYDHPGDTSGSQATTYFLETLITDISSVEVDLFQSGAVVASNSNYAVIALMYDDGVNPPAALATCNTSTSVGTNPTGTWSSLTQFTVPSEPILNEYVTFGAKIYISITKVNAGVTLPRFRLRARAYFDGVRTGP